MDNRKFVYRHERLYEIRYTDVDVEDKLKPIALLAFLNEGAFTSADELGFGYDTVTKINVGFILANWYVELARSIKLGEVLRIVTWPQVPQRIQVFRDYEIFSGDEKVGVAIGRWALIDLSSFKLLPTSAVYGNPILDLHIDFNDFTCCDVVSWRIPRSECGKEIFARPVLYSDLDHYNHVNNTKYADYLFDAFSAEELKSKTIRYFQITYVAQCKEGEMMHVYREDFDEFSLVEVRVDGEVRTQLKVAF